VTFILPLGHHFADHGLQGILRYAFKYVLRKTSILNVRQLLGIRIRPVHISYLYDPERVHLCNGSCGTTNPTPIGFTLQGSHCRGG
jgi:hypothetical protein